MGVSNIVWEVLRKFYNLWNAIVLLDGVREQDRHPFFVRERPRAAALEVVEVRDHLHGGQEAEVYEGEHPLTVDIYCQVFLLFRVNIERKADQHSNGSNRR